MVDIKRRPQRFNVSTLITVSEDERVVICGKREEYNGELYVNDKMTSALKRAFINPKFPRQQFTTYIRQLPLRF